MSRPPQKALVKMGGTPNTPINLAKQPKQRKVMIVSANLAMNTLNQEEPPVIFLVIVIFSFAVRTLQEFSQRFTERSTEWRRAPNKQCMKGSHGTDRHPPSERVLHSPHPRKSALPGRAMRTTIDTRDPDKSTHKHCYHRDF